MTGRIKSLDTLKGVAIFAVICLHVVPVQDVVEVSRAWQIWNQVCRFAVPCFFLTAGFLFMGVWRRSADTTGLLRRYAVRLLKPFLFWALFYALVPPFVAGAPRGMTAAIGDHLRNIVLYPHAFLMTGFVYHLWFLSSLLQATLLVGLTLRFANVRVAVGMGVILYAISLLGDSYSSTPWGLHLGFDMKAGPLVSTVFFATGAWLAQRERQFSFALGALLTGGGLALHLMEALWLERALGKSLTSHGYLVGTLPYAVGILIMALARPTMGGWVSQLGIYSLGLFAFHPYVIEVFRLLPWDSTLTAYPLILAAVVVMTTYLVVRQLSRVRWLRGVLV